MAEVQWIKIYIDMFDKRKIKKLRRLPAGNELLLIWIMLLAMAGKCNAGGMIYITENVPFTEDDLADELGFEVNTIRLALKAFEELDMIETTTEGIINVLGWEEYQNIDKLAELRARDRERKRLKKAQTKALLETSMEIPRKFHGNSTDIPHIEEEREKDKEKESHSIIHAREDAKMKFLGGSLGQGVVLLSDEQMDDLLEKLSIDEFNKYVSIVAECELNGKPYKKKTHYQAILDMVAKDRKTNKG
jgi:predicted phage replisome organizer